jgi:formimidoylglutamate deiminase
MKYFQFTALRQANAWLPDAIIGVDAKGSITYLAAEKPADVNESAIEKIEGFALPGFPNGHSHAFQYAMAGLAENHAGNRADNFWTWREAMYQLALQVSPDEMESIATMLYAEMLRHGYTHVAEFHYLHHDKDGSYYQNKAEMGERLLRAARRACIKITLIPIFYQKGNFGQNPTDRQRRFICKEIPDFQKLWEESQQAVEQYSDASIALGVHSLRAVEPSQIAAALSIAKKFPEMPLHLHIAEQLKEVADCKAYLGVRPVEWLCNNIELNPYFHLVHATHLTEAETIALAKIGTNVVLCPSTEGNLGDGFFNIDTFQKYGGNWSIGTDSHIGLNPFEELRFSDYRQRLKTHQRNIYTSKNEADSGAYALQKAIFTGRKAVGDYASQDYFAIGQTFDAVVIDGKMPLLQFTAAQNLLSTLIYSGDVSWIAGTIVNGKWIIKNQQHQAQDAIRADFSAAIKALRNR